MVLYRLCILYLLLTVAETKRGGASRGRGVSRARTALSGSTRFTRKMSRVGSMERNSLFRASLFGAAAGYLTYRAGRHIINDPDKPIMFDSRQYYWDVDLQTPTDELPVQCVNTIDPNDPEFSQVYFPNNTRPTLIAYGCAEDDYCCGYECCQESSFFSILFRLAVFFLVVGILIMFCIECFRWMFNCTYLIKHGQPRDMEPLRKATAIIVDCVLSSVTAFVVKCLLPVIQVRRNGCYTNL